LSRRATLLRVVKRVLLGGVVLLAALSLALVALTQTSLGRAFLLARVLPPLNAAIPGRVEVRELARLDLSGIALRGIRVLDPGKLEVLRVERVDVEFSARELVRGRIVVHSVVLGSGLVDLRNVTDSRRGLVAAFVDPRAPKAPPSTAPPPYVAVRRLVVRDLDVRAPRAGPVGELDVRRVALDATYELDTTSAATLDRLDAELERGGESIGRIETVTAKLRRGTAPSELALALALRDGPSLRATAKLVAPPEPSFRTRPLTASVRVGPVSSRWLARLLGDSTLETAFSGDLSASLEVSGTLEQLTSHLVLDTPGGPLAVTADVAALERIHAVLGCRDLRLDALRRGLPAVRVTLALAASADVKDPARIPLHVELDQSRLDETALPALRGSAVLTSSSVERLELALDDGASKVEARGRAGFSGAVDLKLSAQIVGSTFERWGRFSRSRVHATGDLRADLTVSRAPDGGVKLHGNVAARGIKTEKLEIERTQIVVALTGEPTRPVGEAHVRIDGARFGNHSVPKLLLDAEGGPTRYRTKLDGDFGEGTALLELELAREKDRVTATAKGHGLIRKRPWAVDLERTSVTGAGAVDSEGLTLDFSGQSLRARGSFSKRGGTLELESGKLELATLNGLLPLSEPLAGTLKLDAHLSGTPAVPVLKASVVGHGLALGERPPFDLDLGIELAADRGEADARLALIAKSAKPGEPRPLDVRLELAHHFHGGGDLARSLAAGTLDARLELLRLDSRWVEAWAKLATLPAEGTLTGNVHVAGTRAAPELRAALSADANVLGVPLEPTLAVAYENGSGHVELGVGDRRGHWLDLAGALAFAGRAPSFEELGERLRRAGSDENWAFTLVSGERNASELPGLTRTSIPATIAATVSVTHTPRSEPHARFRLALAPTAELDTMAESRCSTSHTRVELEGELDAGRLRASLAATDGSTRLLAVSSDAMLRVLPALSGGAPTLGPVHAQVAAERLELATLPVICGLSRGSIDLDARLDDPLGEHPAAKAELTARGLSFGARESVDLTLHARADDERASADLTLAAKDGRATLAAHLPLASEHGKIRVDEHTPVELDAMLVRLPVAPFLNPKGAVSYATGSIDGEVHARGPLAKPDVHGKLVLNDVEFTATDLAQPLRRVRGSFEFTRNHLKIDHFEAHDRKGVLKVDGNVELESEKQLTVALDVNAKDFPVRQQGEVVATTDLEAKVRAKVEPERSDVKIELGAVDMWIESLALRSGMPLAAHPDFAIDGRPSPLEASRAPAPERAKTAAPKAGVTHLELVADERIWIKRDDFAVKLSADLNTEIAAGEARVKGRVLLRRGYVSLMGKDFDIQKGSSLVFIGATEPDPVLDITAVHQNRRSGRAISVIIGGRGSKPTLTFKVDDQLVTAGEAFSAIYGSQQSNQDPKAADNQAKAFVGGLTAGLLATTARRELGAAAPIIMIEPGTQTGTGRLRAGFEFDSLVPPMLKDVITGVYFEGIVSNGNEGDTQGNARTEAGVLLEFYFPKNFFTTGQYGPGTTWSMDVGWQL
jgi:autotransporter translocation and assembly factor TamB